ncbi:uncharacterized protein LOC142768380 [Rhipicephalus microplus]|uniref:uncharacterized protein LOC142768380 n=1 Tax=Rhipicephalus microplus TaxID=6941 RepID=UPI003F6CE6F4
MSTTVQLLLVYFVVQTQGQLYHQQPAQAEYPGAGSAGYAAAGRPYQGYDYFTSPPQPYSFGYGNVDEYGNRQFRSEQGHLNNAKMGSYGYQDVNGLYRRVNYVADANGFRATVDTNEPGTTPGASADAVFNAASVVPPVATRAALGGARVPYATGASAPYYAGGYRSYGRYGNNAYVGVAKASEYASYGRTGYGAHDPAFGGQAHGGSSLYGFGTAGFNVGYAPGAYGTPTGYHSFPSAHHGYHRRA